MCMQMLTACVNAGLKPDATALNERLENWTQRDFKHAISGGEIQNKSEQGWWLQMQLPQKYLGIILTEPLLALRVMTVFGVT